MSIYTRLTNVEERVEKLAPKTKTKVYAVLPDGSEIYLYSYPDNKARILKILAGNDYRPNFPT